MKIGAQSRAIYAFYTSHGERKELFFSFAGFQRFAAEHGWYVTTSGNHSRHPNAQLFVIDIDTHECIGYLGKSWA